MCGFEKCLMDDASLMDDVDVGGKLASKHCFVLFVFLIRGCFRRGVGGKRGMFVCVEGVDSNKKEMFT